MKLTRAADMYLEDMKRMGRITSPHTEADYGQPCGFPSDSESQSSDRPRLLDLFCGAGGAAMGYHRAGFEVVGVDIEPQPNYPFEFVWADALNPPLTFVDFDAIHASPPCQRFSRGQRIQANDHPDLVSPIRGLLLETGKPYVIENVPGAPLGDPITLCGTMFGLPLYRHRLFETNFPVTEPLHAEHWLPQVKMGRRPGPDEIVQVVGNFTDAEAARRAMGTPWMTRSEMSEAIPPAYTQFIGEAMLAHIEAKAAA